MTVRTHHRRQAASAGLEDPGASRVDHSSYITGTELFVDGGLAQI